MKRIPSHELLDTDAGTPGEVAGSLSDLRMFNRWFGGTSCTYRLVARVARETKSNSLSLLDVAAGSGYVPCTVGNRLSRKNIRLDITLLDRAASHIGNGGGSVVGDALALPFAMPALTWCAASYLFHHLSPDQLGRFAGRACSLPQGSSH